MMDTLSIGTRSWSFVGHPVEENDGIDRTNSESAAATDCYNRGVGAVFFSSLDRVECDPWSGGEAGSMDGSRGGCSIRESGTYQDG